jgi:manganese oxidase
MRRHVCGETNGMKNFTRGFLLSAVAAGALIAGVINFAAADGQSPAAAPVPAVSPFVVTMKDFAFSPSTIKVPVGATVKWKNDDSAAHTVTSTSKGFDSGNLDSGRSFTFTFTKSGSYGYVCTYHPNMTGMVVVEPATESPSH